MITRKDFSYNCKKPEYFRVECLDQENKEKKEVLQEKRFSVNLKRFKIIAFKIEIQKDLYIPYGRYHQ